MTAPADSHRDPATMGHLRLIAEDVFRRHGVDFKAVSRAGEWTNATWIGGGLVLRLSTLSGSEKIRREARLTALFPPEVGSPEVIETGVTDGFEWGLTKEIPGVNLGEAWPSLDWKMRTAALCQLWEKTRAVHRVPVEAAAPLARTKPWFNATSAEEATAGLKRLTAQRFLCAEEERILGAALERFWTARKGAACALNHGDLTIENALWRDGQVTALLDFEFAVIAPVELDLNELVKMAFAPGEEEGRLPDLGGEGLSQLRDAVVEMALPILRHMGGCDLLRGYAILLELWLMEDWLEHPEGEGPVEGWLPYRMLRSLSDGTGGYLRPLLERAIP